MEAEEILKELGIEQDIIAIYPYGSQVYGNATKYSDNDYIIVAKSTLPSGAFKDNAISNENRTIQGTLYSRAGFIDAINKLPARMLSMTTLRELRKECFMLLEFSTSDFN